MNQPDEVTMDSDKADVGQSMGRGQWSGYSNNKHKEMRGPGNRDPKTMIN